MKNQRGRKRPAGAKQLMEQVQEEFAKQKERIGIARAAKDLGVVPSSFYKYLAGDVLPDMGILRKAHEIWGIRWKHMDFSEIMPKLEVRTPQQLVLSFLDDLKTRDIEVVSIGPKPKKQNVLEITLNIRFSA